MKPTPRKRRQLTKAEQVLEQTKYEQQLDQKYQRELAKSKKLIAWIQRLNKKYGI